MDENKQYSTLRMTYNWIHFVNTILKNILYFNQCNFFTRSQEITIQMNTLNTLNTLQENYLSTLLLKTKTGHGGCGYVDDSLYPI